MNIPTVEQLVQYEADGWLRSSRHPTLPLRIFTYNHATQYAQNWDEVTEQTRGIVYDDDGLLVQLPLRKMHNITDPRAPQIEQGAYFRAYDKMDGSLILASLYKGETVVSTKGSFTSPQAEAARPMLKGWSPPEGWTVLFEYIAPDNRIVVDYGEFNGLVLLGAVRHEDGMDSVDPDSMAEFTAWPGEVVVERKLHMHTLLSMLSNVGNGENREGFVLVVPNQTGPSVRVKAKFASYVALHALMSGLTDKRVWECWDEGTIDQYIDQFPDEMYLAIQEYVQLLTREMQDKMLAGQALYERALTYSDNDRKEQASIITSSMLSREIQGIAFCLLSGEQERAEAIARKMVKPDISTPLQQQVG